MDEKIFNVPRVGSIESITSSAGVTRLKLSPPKLARPPYRRTASDPYYTPTALVPLRTGSHSRSRATPSPGYRSNPRICSKCNSEPSFIRCLECPSTSEGCVMCIDCASRNCKPTHMRTRPFYEDGELLEAAMNDEHRRREYKSLLRFLAHRNGVTALDFVKQKIAKYINGFVNSGGGAILFGIDETQDDKTVVESVKWSRPTRSRTRIVIRSVANSMCPPVDAALYQVVFNPVLDPLDNFITDRYVLEVHVHGDTKNHGLRSVRPPRCFVELCEAYERHDEQTKELKIPEISRRLGVLAVPPPIDFRAEVEELSESKLRLVSRQEIDEFVVEHVHQGKNSKDKPRGLLLLGETGTGKSVWAASHIRHSIAAGVAATAKQVKSGIHVHPNQASTVCFECGKVFQSRGKLFRHLNKDGWCPQYVNKMSLLGLSLPSVADIESGKVTPPYAAKRRAEAGKDVTNRSAVTRVTGKDVTNRSVTRVTGGGKTGALSGADRGEVLGAYFKAAEMIDVVIMGKGKRRRKSKRERRKVKGKMTRAKEKSLREGKRWKSRIKDKPGVKILAFHMCLQRDKLTTDPGRFVRSIAAQLAKNGRHGGIRLALSREVTEHELAAHRVGQNPHRALDRGVLAPLRSIQAPPGSPYVVLVDGLDEALEYQPSSSTNPKKYLMGGQRFSTTIVDVLSQAILRFPPWLVLICTSRYNPTIERLCPQSTFERLHVAEAARLDMERYISLRLRTLTLPDSKKRSEKDPKKEKERRYVERKIKARLCQLAGGNFLYASMVLDSLERGTLDAKVLATKSNRGLNDMYQANFTSIFPTSDAYLDPRAPARPLLEVLLAARSRVSQRSLNATLRFSEKAITKVRMYLQRTEERVTDGAGGGEASWQIFHASLAEWLETSGDRFVCSKGRGHALIASSILRGLYRTIGVLKGGEDAVRTWLGKPLARYIPADVHQHFALITPSLVYDAAWHLSEAMIYGAPDAVALLRHLKVHTLATNGYALDSTDPSGRSPVFIACQEDGTTGALSLLLRAKAFPHPVVRPQRLSALHIAARRPVSSFVDLLVKYKAKVDYRSADGRTPLCVAAGKGYDRSTRILLEAGANRHIESSHGRTPIHYATANGNVKVVSLLLEQTPSFYRLIRPAFLLTSALLSYLAFRKRGSTRGVAPALAACTATAGALFAPACFPSGPTLRATLRKKDSFGCDPLLLAARNGDAKLVQILLKNGADPKTTGRIRGVGASALWHAADAGRLEVVRVLLKLS
ncbi:hypothetical protein AAMO2058_000730000 [Amorphochlora amoebiformis]